MLRILLRLVQCACRAGSFSDCAWGYVSGLVNPPSMAIHQHQDTTSLRRDANSSLTIISQVASLVSGRRASLWIRPAGSGAPDPLAALGYSPIAGPIVACAVVAPADIPSQSRYS